MLRLRPYKNTDASAVVSWIDSEGLFDEWSLGELGDYPPDVDTFNAFSQKVSNDKTIIQLIAADDDKTVGYITLRYLQSDLNRLRMGSFILDPACYGHGYGFGMVSLALKYAFDILKATSVTILLSAANDFSLKSFKGMGFAETGASEQLKVSGGELKVIEFEMVPEMMADSEPEDIEVAGDDMILEIITANRFSYALQPIVDAASGEIEGYEALMRTDAGVNVSPMAVLDCATRKNMLYTIEKQTMFNVMDMYVTRMSAFGDRKLFINSIPGSQLNEKDYNSLLKKYGSYLSNVVIEVTENTEFKDQELSVLLDRSARDGYSLAIDDFGTGYSNTSSLLSYLPNYLKIDRLLISNIHEEPKKQHFVKSIIEFAKTNGVKTLAEGVETSAELKAVIELGVDYIQGYYTSRPSFEVAESIDADIRSEIIASSVKGTNQEVRRIYTVNGERELPIMRLALEKYTGILIEQEEFTLVGNTGYSAEMSIKIKDGTKCRLTIRDVFIESTQQLPCIEIGAGSELTLVLEGESRMNKYGIQVPDSSKLIIEGAGNLQIRSQGVSSFAIGNAWNAEVGDITWRGTGALDILVEADEGIGIGGGCFGRNCGVHIHSGMVRIEPASGKAVALGSVSGKPLIEIMDCKIQLDVKIEKGVGIGSMEGDQHTFIRNVNMNILCAGSHIAAIGGVGKSGGNIEITDSEVSVLANGQELYLIGATEGDVVIRFTESAINLRGEGNNVLALGTRDLNATIKSKTSICNIKLASGTPVLYGAKPENTSFSGGLQSISVNE